MVACIIPCILGALSGVYGPLAVVSRPRDESVVLGRRALPASTVPVEFESSPAAQEVAIGRAAYRAGAGLDRTLMADHAVLGTWFDGRVRRAVDTATWLSPKLVSRCLGYLAERDALSADSIAKRWALARAQLGGKLTFIVRLAAFPRLDPFELGIGAPPKPETLRGVKFRLSVPTPTFHADPGYVWSDGNLIANSIVQSAISIEKEAPEAILGRPFFSLTPYAALFLSDGEVDPPDDGIPLGDYYGAIYVVSFPFCAAMNSASELELDVQLPSKRERANFALAMPPPHEPVPRHDD